jgi:addiction module HigA family antidote
MLMTKRQPATVGEILVEEFMQPMGLTQAVLAEAMVVQRKHVNELCNNRRNVTAATALILARVFGNSPDFWLSVQRRSDLWEAMNSPPRARADRTCETAERCRVISATTPLASPEGRNSRGARVVWVGAEPILHPVIRSGGPVAPD